MRNQFNYEERLWHLISLGGKGAMTCLIQSGAVSEQEKIKLKSAIKDIDDFTDMTVKRMGSAYAHKLQGTANVNEVRVVGKSQPYKDLVSYCDADDMKEGLGFVQSIVCLGCDRKDHCNCGIYKMLTACDVLGFNGEENNCPYQLADIGEENGLLD